MTDVNLENTNISLNATVSSDHYSCSVYCLWGSYLIKLVQTRSRYCINISPHFKLIRQFWTCILPFRGRQQKKNAPTGRQSKTPLFTKYQKVLVSLEGSSKNARQRTSPQVDCMQTLPFSLHLSKHVALFRRFVSRGPAVFFRTPGNQPSQVFCHPQNVKFTFPQGDVFQSRGIHPVILCVWADNCCACWKEV